MWGCQGGKSACDEECRLRGWWAKACVPRRAQVLRSPPESLQKESETFCGWRRSSKIAIFALANKRARGIWEILTRGEDYRCCDPVPLGT